MALMYDPGRDCTRLGGLWRRSGVVEGLSPAVTRSACSCIP
jgi:hypothetical protein